MNPPKRQSLDWPSVLREHDRWLRTVVLSRTGERGAVDEVMQEVALAAVRQSAPLEDVSRVAPWLYRLAVVQSLLYRRRQGRSRNLAHRYAQHLQDGVAAGHTPDPLDWLLSDELRAAVREALAHLPPRDAEILLLKYTESWSYQQLSARLGISSSAVEARLHRARGRLRGQLVKQQVVEVEP
jgi:RNA polymerase sigma factor (sigma-70 family)